MIIHFPSELLKAVIKAGAKSPAFKEETWRGLDVDSRVIEQGDFDIIKKVIAATKELIDKIENRRVIRKLTTVEELVAGKKEKKIARLETLAEALTVYFSKLAHKWLFRIEDDRSQPYYIESVEFKPGEAYSPPHVLIELDACERGKHVGNNERIQHEKIRGGITVTDLLKKLDLYPETPELLAEHASYVSLHEKYAKQMGEQFLGRGYGNKADERDEVSLVKDGQPTRVVMDDLYGVDDERSKEKSPFVSTKFWTPGKDKDDDDGLDPHAVLAPLKPTVQVFSLASHEFITTHIANLEPYVYDETLQEKLILPEKDRRLIDILTSSSIKRMDDIIKGKASGVIVLCSGPPGVGKSLTSEVYAETVKRPLYSVQCSQLGTDEVKLEEKLSTVLELAARWRAILLIDEADVYVHERGSDIVQNAIVGVFLRVLEYYKGILFLTTNRATIIDDAIISRLTAHVRYGLPSHADAVKIWKVLAKQYAVALDPAACAGSFKAISGRSIRQLIRLAKMMADNDDAKSISIELLKRAAEYHDFSTEEST